MRGGLNHLIAGAASALALPAATFGLGLPFPAALPVAVALYAGLALLLAPRRLPAVGTGQAEFIAGLIADGEATVGRLRVATRALQAADARRTVAHLAEVGQAILDRLAAEPGKLPAVRRFLTYYLPQSAAIAEGLGTVERQRVPDARRRAEIGAVLVKLDQAFITYADSFAQGDLDALDVDLKLLGHSLEADLAPTTVPREKA